MSDQERLLRLEIERLKAIDIELIHSPDSLYEFELINNRLNIETTDLDVFATLESLEKLSTDAGSDTFWDAVVDAGTERA